MNKLQENKLRKLVREELNKINLNEGVTPKEVTRLAEQIAE
jgi:hypothetical protein